VMAWDLLSEQLKSCNGYMDLLIATPGEDKGCCLRTSFLVAMLPNNAYLARTDYVLVTQTAISSNNIKVQSIYAQSFTEAFQNEHLKKHKSNYRVHLSRISLQPRCQLSKVCIIAPRISQLGNALSGHPRAMVRVFYAILSAAVQSTCFICIIHIPVL